MVANCRSCGAVLGPDPSMVAESSEIAGYCQDCVDRHGHPMSYEDVFQRLVGEYIRKEGMDVASAERTAENRMTGLPAWG